jgi:hypothetical protein
LILLDKTQLLEGASADELWWRILITCLATFLINLPFGYFRGGLRKFSFWWFVVIHAPVPLVIQIREYHNLSLSWALAPFLLGSYFLGQFIGRKIYAIKPYKKPNFKSKEKSSKD